MEESLRNLKVCNFMVDVVLVKVEGDEWQGGVLACQMVRFGSGFLAEGRQVGLLEDNRDDGWVSVGATWRNGGMEGWRGRLR